MIAKNKSTIAKDFIDKGYSENCPIINMHGHFGLYARSYMPLASVERMIEVMNRCGMIRIVCSSHQFISSDPDYGNLIMKKATLDNAERFLGYWGVNPNYGNIIRKDLNNFDKLIGFVGFKFGPDYHRYPLTGKNYEPALKFANERALIILVHTFGGSIFNSPQMLAEVANKYNKIKFIMGHSGFGDWEYSISIAKNLPNVYLDLTAIYIAHDFSQLPYKLDMPHIKPSLNVNGIIEYIVEKATSKKLVYGDDLPWHAPYFAIGAVLFADINDDAKHDIMHRNAELLLKNFL